MKERDHLKLMLRPLRKVQIFNHLSNVWEEIIRNMWYTNDFKLMKAEKNLLDFMDIHYQLQQVEISNNRVINTFSTGDINLETAVVFTHGFGAAFGIFYKNFTHIDNVLAIDWLGMGRSSRSPITSSCPFEIEDYFVDALEEWRVKMKIKSLILVAHSFGGYLSTLYAIKYPLAVHKLILISPVGFPEKPKTNFRSTPKWIELCWNYNITPQTILRALGPLSKVIVDEMATARFKLPPHELHLLKEYMYYSNMNKGAGEYSMNPLLMPGAYARHPLLYRFPSIQCDCHFIYGNSDWMHIEGAKQSISNHKEPNKHKIHFLDGGHFMFLDNPTAFNTLINQLL